MRIMLFTTPTCHYCGPAKEMLAEVEGVEYIDATENMELAAEYGIRAVPTLIVAKCSGAYKFTGLEEIQEYIAGSKESSGCGCSCGH